MRKFSCTSDCSPFPDTSPFHRFSPRCLIHYPSRASNSILSIRFRQVIFTRIAERSRDAAGWVSRIQVWDLSAYSSKWGRPADAKIRKARRAEKPSASFDSCITRGCAIMHVDYDLCVSRATCRFNFICVEMHDTRRVLVPTSHVTSKFETSRRVASCYIAPSRNLVSSSDTKYPAQKWDPLLRRVLSIIIHFPRIWKSAGYIGMITTPRS